MHNLHAIFAKFLEICKQFSKEMVNEKGNIPRVGVVPRFSDLEVISLSLTAEALSIDSERSLSLYHSQKQGKELKQCFLNSIISLYYYEIMRQKQIIP